MTGVTKIQDFQVFGERRSGTNYIRALIAKNLKIKHVHHYGWKHGPPTMPAISKNSLLVLAVRDPVEWVKGLYVNPYEIAEHLRVALPFTEFIRHEWEAVALPGMQGWEKYGHYQNQELRGEELQWDRHPITGARYKNVLEMRTVKYQAWLGLRQRAKNFALIRYEDARDEPEKTIAKVASDFGISQKPNFTRIEKRLGNFSIFPKGTRERPDQISDADLTHIKSQLDRHLEQKLGYKIDQI